MNRRIFSDAKIESDWEVCYNSELIPDVFDILGKSGFFHMSGTAKNIFLMKTDGTVQDFDKIIPGLL